jgi:hypothetical protein
MTFGTMKRLALFIITIFFFSSLNCHAKTDNDNLFSIDLSYALTGFLNQGWGIGLGYEKKAVDFLSFTGGFGHMTFLTGIKDVYCTSVSLSLFSNYYPLSSGLDKLYVSVGGGCDFMNYFGSGEFPDTAHDTLIHITPQLGWKINALRFLMIDVSTGYKFIITDTQNYNEIKDYVNPGFRFNLGFKVFFRELIKVNSNDQDG